MENSVSVPAAKQESLLAEAHAERFSDHFSPKAMYMTLVKRYWWDRMYRDVYSHCTEAVSLVLPIKVLDGGRNNP